MMQANTINHKVNLPVDFFKSLKFDETSLKKYRVQNAELCAKTLGNKPALLFSGGVDSQAMIQCWLEANLSFEIVIFTFKNGLNIQDSDHAKHYCTVNNLPYKEIVFDVVSFLNRENFDIGMKYKCPSPHFTTHFKMAEILRDQGYTGICCGGFAPNKTNNIYGSNFVYNTCVYTQVHDILGIPFQGNFLSYTPELAWAITLLTENLDVVLRAEYYDDYFKLVNERYEQKIKGYQRTGFNIIPQNKKYTGFELVNKFYDDLTGDGLAFEKRFRHTLVNHLKRYDFYLYQFELSNDQLEDLSRIHFINLAPTLSTSSGISD